MAVHQRLKAYLDQKAREPFSWRDNNCKSFVVEYLDLPELPVAWFRGHDTPRACFMAYTRKAEELGCLNLSDMFDDLLVRQTTLFPHSGYVVGRPLGGAFGLGYGLHWMGYNYFLTDKAGLQPFDPAHADVYWSVP